MTSVTCVRVASALSNLHLAVNTEHVAAVKTHLHTDYESKASFMTLRPIYMRRKSTFASEL